MFKPLLNLNRTLPGHELMVQFYVQQISWTKRKVRFCIRQNSGRTELDRTLASLMPCKQWPTKQVILGEAGEKASIYGDNMQLIIICVM